VIEGKRGQTRDARIKSTDVSKARGDVRNSQYTTRWIHMGMAELKQHQITYDVTGILEPLAANHEIDTSISTVAHYSSQVDPRDQKSRTSLLIYTNPRISNLVGVYSECAGNF
jgi:hypothetical protein